MLHLRSRIEPRLDAPNSAEWLGVLGAAGSASSSETMTHAEAEGEDRTDVRNNTTQDRTIQCDSTKHVTQDNTLPYNTIQSNTVQYNHTKHNALQYKTTRYDTKTRQNWTMQHNTAQQNTIKYSRAQYNTCVLRKLLSSNLIHESGRTKRTGRVAPLNVNDASPRPPW